MKKIIISIGLGIALIACKGKLNFTKQKGENEKIIVQYGKHFLTDQDILLILPQDYTKEDSTKLVNLYIEEWVKKKAIVDKAEENIDELTLKEIENKMVEYRQDLLINAYNNYLIEKTISDSVSEVDILNYFEKNKNSFPLAKTIIQYRAVTVHKEDESRAEKLFNSGKEEDFDELMSIVLNSGTAYNDKDSLWPDEVFGDGEPTQPSSLNLLPNSLEAAYLYWSSPSGHF